MKDSFGEGVVKTVYDMAMDTSQMLTCMEERLARDIHFSDDFLDF